MKKLATLVNRTATDLSTASQEKMTRLAHEDATVLQRVLVLQERVVAVQVFHLAGLALYKKRFKRQVARTNKK